MQKRLSGALLVIFAVLLTAACATPMQSGSACAVDPEYFDTRKTFAWVDTERSLTVRDDTGFISPLVEEQLRNAVINELQSKGFRYVEDTATSDLQLALTLHARREIEVYETENLDCPNCWEVINPEGTRFNLRTVGFLAMDIYTDGAPVWRSWVERTLHPSERDKSEQLLADAVPRLLEDFPPENPGDPS